MEKILIHATRKAYGLEDIHRTMTVADLISFLETFDEGTEVYISNDNGYTYGPVLEELMEIREDEED